MKLTQKQTHTHTAPSPRLGQNEGIVMESNCRSPIKVLGLSGAKEDSDNDNDNDDKSNNNNNNNNNN
jgi:hypothetical protein